MASNSENILSESTESEPSVSPSGDVINVESNEIVLTSEKANDFTNPNREIIEPMNVSDDVEKEPRQSVNEGAINIAYENSLKILEAENSINKNKIFSLEKLVNKATAEIRELKVELDETNEYVDQLEDRLCDVETENEVMKQTLLRNSVMIFGVPKKKNENLMNLLLAIANAKSVNVADRDVCEIQRNNYREGAPICVEFDSSNKTKEFLRTRKTVLKGVFEADKVIIVREALTRNFEKMRKITRAAQGDGKLKDFSVYPSGLKLILWNGTVNGPIISIGKLKTIIAALPKTGKKSRRNGYRKRTRRSQRRNRNRSNRQN